MNLREQLLTVTDAYCLATGRSPSRVSTLVLNDGKRFAAIKAGGDLATGKFEHAMSWFSSNWPDDAPWPEAVVRPQPVSAEAEQAGAAP